MPRQENDGKSGSARDGSAAGHGRDEFEDAVTTEISGTLRKAFGDDFPSADYSHVEVTDIDLSAQPMPAEFELLEPGSVLNDRFEIVELVHSGGMSHVYRAIDLRRHRKGSGPIHVAIKTMRRMIASQRESRLSLEREASRAQRLSHPNIINVFDFDDHEGCFYLVMEWLEGESVNTLLKRTRGQRLDPSFAWPIIEGAASAIQHAHMNNIVHADINPSNIFITATHEIKLLDFGVARDCGDKSDVAESRLAWATQTYASPELLSGMAPVFEDDIFSLGCVAYRLLSGDHPFSGSTSIQARDEEMKVAPIAGLRDDDWQTIRRCLEYKRINRPKTAAVLNRNAQHPAGSDRADRRSAYQRGRWLLGFTAVAIFAATGWWAWSNLPQLQGIAPADESAVVEAVVPAPAEISPTEALVAEAAMAMAGQRYLEPADDNARDRYRQVLSIQPDNPAALRGLRLISDSFVRDAEAALRAGEPTASTQALQIATETDTSNPAIALVRSLLVTEGDRQLADARSAATAGDVTRTVALLAVAEQFDHIGADELEQVRDTLTTRLRKDELLSRIAVVDEHMVNGRLLAPEADNALALLTELADTYGENADLDAAKERLGGRLLSHAAIASGAGEYEVALEYLDAVDGLSIAGPDVALARSSLQTAMAATTSVAAGTQEAGESASDAIANAEMEPATPVALAATAGGSEIVAAEDAAAMAAEPVAAEELTTMAEEPVAENPAAAAVVPQRVRARTLSELGIERFVAPSFPRSARRRGLSGFVQIGFAINPDGTTGNWQILNAEPPGVFNKSAENAVRQWRFEQRESAVQASIVLTFNAEP